MVTDSEIRQLSEAVNDRLRSLHIKCGFAESLTGGMISSSVVDIPGASDVFEGSVVSYTNAMKINVLKVPSEVIDEYTEVSVQCAEYMASGVRTLTGSDICISVTGYAGGKDHDDRDGYVCIGYWYNGRSGSVDEHYEGNRTEVRMQTVMRALQLIMELTDNE